MDRRIELGNILKAIPGVKKVYFQPPESIELVYPCIVYHLQSVDTIYANNYPYRNEDAYQLMIIDRNPDSAIRHYVEKLPMCRFDRYYSVENLNHWLFVMYY